MIVLVPTTIELDLRGHEQVPYDPSVPFPGGSDRAEALVVWLNTPPNLRAATELPALRLVQTLAAGPDAIVAAGFGEGVTLCSGRSLHDGPVAEHALALILALVRRLDVFHDAQHEHRWTRDMATAQADPETARRYTLDGARVTLWGFGSIAARLALQLMSLGAEVTGIAQTAGVRRGVTVVADREIDAVLAQTDLLVSLLPATPDTWHLVNANRLAKLPAHAHFVNVGRGSVVDEQALADALSAGRLAGAALDVFETEPLPADSPLWDAPRLIVTPHVAGGRPQGASELVQSNLDAFAARRPLRNTVRR